MFSEMQIVAVPREQERGKASGDEHRKVGVGSMMPPASTRRIVEGADLELLVERASGERRRTSLLFVHGISVGAWVWQMHYLPYFAAAGFDCFAVSLRGHGGSAGRDRIQDWRLRDYVRDVANAIDRIDGPVVLVGHSMGGAVVQRYVREQGSAAGMALLASVPPWGLAPSTWRMAVASPRSFLAMLGIASGREPSRSDPALREALFSADTPAPIIQAFADRAGPESPWAGFDTQGWPPLAPMPWAAPPTFVMGGSDDRLIPRDEVWRTGLYYAGSATIVPRLAHAVMVEPRWEDGAEALRAWLLRVFD